MGETPHLPESELDSFRRKWHLSELTLIGSGARGDLRPDSDLDFLVSWEAGHNASLFDFVAMEEELAAIVHRKVDLISRSAIEASDNFIVRQHMLAGSKLGFSRDPGTLLRLHKALARVTSFTAGHDLASFRNDQLTQDAAILQLMKASHAVERLSRAFRTEHADIPWTRIAGWPKEFEIDLGKWDVDRTWEAIVELVQLEPRIEPLVPKQH